MARASGVRAFVHRTGAGCVANLGLKIVSIVIAIVIYVLVRRSTEEGAPPHEDPPAHAP